MPATFPKPDTKCKMTPFAIGTREVNLKAIFKVIYTRMFQNNTRFFAMQQSLAKQSN